MHVKKQQLEPDMEQQIRFILEKVSFHSKPKEGQCQRMFKLPDSCTHFHATKVIFKILQARLQQYVNQELPHV